MLVQSMDVFSVSDASFNGTSVAGGCRETYALERDEGRANLLVFLRRKLKEIQDVSSSTHAGFSTLRRSDPLCLLHGADQHIPIS